jgi:DNA-binding IscR family transcriptional regulator
MQLMAQEEYGLRCLLELSRHAGPEPLTIQQIARAEGLSPDYTAKLLRELRRGGLVHSLCVRGSDCSIRTIWRLVDEAVRGVLSAITLRDLQRAEMAMATWLETRPKPLWRSQ